ncbi:LPS assembly protein LptD [Piscinibacter sp. XHJ-5]|uniref:LPS-assembly protein LptD n=1 Tax=Piscinibacter sp. XHJ-5 TaxID=3037797 RepID=UPI002452CFB5|nr:LPS assembly protein LptD [Piscinibacter sp. XHJ-5]
MLRRSRTDPRTPPARLAPVAAALAMLGGGAGAQQVPDTGIALELSTTLRAPLRGDAGKKLPIVLLAREIRGRPDLETIAEGDAEFRRGGIVLRADRLSYDHPEDLAIARGSVRISRDGNIYSGPELQLRVERFEGFFLNPSYYFSRTGAGGSAQRIDFIDDQRAVAIGATYTSCPADGSGDPDWLLSTSRVKMDFEANEGIAEGAVLRFMGVPILGAPVLSFPLSDARKSGWLPPNINLDSKSGLQTSVPYYWNIAPNRDATLTPGISVKRGVSLGSEFRYLEPRYTGKVNLDLMPEDRLIGRERHAFAWQHDASLIGDTQLRARVLRVSDNDYWKDFPRDLPSLTPRLLLSELNATRPLGDWTTYVRAMRWQVLQNAESPIDPAVSTAQAQPQALVTHLYERLPQIGARTLRRYGDFELAFEGEFNRFAKPVEIVDPARPTGTRVHALASIARPWITPGWTLTPRMTLNAASYSLDRPLEDGRRSASRVIPTFSLDSAWVLERDTTWLGRAVRQTLEPRLLYVNTPFRDQSGLPNFDSAAKDFNFESIYTDNVFSGVDRVSDANQITAGITTRLLDPLTGAEAVRLGIVQRYLFRDQRITPEGPPFTQRFSDVLLLGSSTLFPRWTIDGSVQYSPDIGRTVRSIVGLRYSPGPFRTVNATYRLARGLTEQLELGWQWPLYGPVPDESSAAPRSALRTDAKGCKGTWYGVGRINYSMRDSRITDSIMGVEYDAGCWIGRVVAERLSTGRSEATTRLLLQLELVGLSRLGSNPLQVLKDNIPGYRLLRDDRPAPATTTFYD